MFKPYSQSTYVYPIPFLGVRKAITELQDDYDSYKIETLCTRSKKVLCFPSARSLKQFAYKFAVMTQEYNSSIFNSIWSKTMHLKLNVTISDVGPTIWEPVFLNCQQLLEELHSGSMTLSDVDKHFYQYKGEQQRLERELKSLFHGVNKCCEMNEEDSSWIHQAVTRIAEYWRLCTYCEAAHCFLKLRDSLELTRGDFKLVERIFKGVRKLLHVNTCTCTMNWGYNAYCGPTVFNIYVVPFCYAGILFYERSDTHWH